MQEIHDGVVREAQAGLAAKDLWCGHHVLVADGSTVTAPDTLENQNAFPQESVQKSGCGFPIIRLVALLNLATGMLTAWTTGNWYQHAVCLLQMLWDCLQPDAVLLADRGFCNWGGCWLNACNARFTGSFASKAFVAATSGVEGSRIVLKPGATEISGFCRVFAVVAWPRADAMSAASTRMSGLLSSARRIAASSVSPLVVGAAI